MPETYDAVIVGSGAGGAMSAYMLTKAGASVLLLEAGRDYNPDEAPMLNLSKDAPLRGSGTPAEALPDTAGNEEALRRSRASEDEAPIGRVGRKPRDVVRDLQVIQFRHVRA